MKNQKENRIVIEFIDECGRLNVINEPGLGSLAWTLDCMGIDTKADDERNKIIYVHYYSDEDVCESNKDDRKLSFAKRVMNFVKIGLLNKLIVKSNNE